MGLARYTIPSSGIAILTINFDAKDDDKLYPPSFGIRQPLEGLEVGGLGFKIYKPFQANNGDLIDARLVSSEGWSGGPILIAATIDKTGVSEGEHVQYSIEIRDQKY